MSECSTRLLLDSRHSGQLYNLIPVYHLSYFRLLLRPPSYHCSYVLLLPYPPSISSSISSSISLPSVTRLLLYYPLTSLPFSSSPSRDSTDPLDPTTAEPSAECPHIPIDRLVHRWTRLWIGGAPP